MSLKAAVIGAGWAGATTARTLSDAGVDVRVFEAAPDVGGHARAEVLNGVVYEPHGAHIFHTSDEEVATFVRGHGLIRPFEHKVLTQVDLGDGPVLLSWPPQISELRALPIWPRVERELAALDADARPADDFESHVIGLMGPTLYELFIRDYTMKQWGTDPKELSSRIAPKRVELRDDGDRRLFRDRWEFFPSEGYNSIIESILSAVPVACGSEISREQLGDLERSFDAIVITAPLDSFLGRGGELEWRGIEMRSTYHPMSDETGTVTPAYVVNHPSASVPYTRTVETKHATGQLIAGTVVSEEYPGAPERHYPVLTVDQRNEQLNERMKAEIRDLSGLQTYFCGRLANYVYINQDQAVRQGLECARRLLRDAT